MSTVDGPARERRSSSFRSLGVRNFRLFWAGQLVSKVGSWLNLTAVSWLVLTDLGGTGTHVGFLAAARFLPTLLFGTWAGVVADRCDVHRLVVRTQTALLVVASCMAVLTFADLVDLWMVFPLVAAEGLVVAFENPSRQSFISEMVDGDLIANAVALNSAGFNSARIIGPAVAGLLIESFGTTSCFALNAATYVVSLAALVAIRRSELHPRPVVARARGQIRDGLRYALRTPVLRAALTAMAVVGTVSMNFTVLVPLLAEETFDASAQTFGFLSTAMGFGSLVGSLVAARTTAPTLTHQAIGAFGLAGAMLSVAVSPTLAVAMVAIAVAGAFVMTFVAATNSILQLNAEPEMRGRVLSLYLVLFIGTSPVGSPFVGVIAEHLGTRTAFLYGACGALVGGVLVFRRRLAALSPTHAITHEGAVG